MENPYGVLNHPIPSKRAIIHEEDDQPSSSSPPPLPPPPRPRKSLEKLRKAKEENIYVNLTNVSFQQNNVYDEPVKSSPPPPYPPPPLPPRIATRLNKSHQVLERVSEISTEGSDVTEESLESVERSDEDTENRSDDNDIDSDDIHGGEEIYQQITTAKTRPKFDQPPPLPPRFQRQTSDPVHPLDKSNFSSKLEKALVNQFAALNSPDNRYGLVRANTLPTKTSNHVNNNNNNNNSVPYDIEKIEKTGKAASTSSSPSSTMTESPNGPKKPPRKPANDSEIMRPTEQLQDKTGYLYKTGPTRKTFHQRWCLLNKEKFSYYHDEPVSDSGKEIEPKGVIDLSNIVLIGTTLNPPAITTKSSKGIPWRNQSNRKDDSLSSTNSKPAGYVDIGVSNSSGRMFLFASECQEDIADWMEALALRVEPQIQASLAVYRDFTFAGYVHMKLGISGTWIRCWLVLRNRELAILTDLDGSESENSIMTIDLRKVMSICYSSSHQITPCADAKEPGQPVYLNRNHDTGLFIQGSYKAHTELLYTHLTKSWMTPVNGSFSDQLLTPSGIPIAIEKCLNFICTYGGVRTKGIYSTPGEESMVKKLIEPLMSNAVWELHIRPEDGYTVHEVASALKQYLKSFSECLLTDLMYPEWWDNNSIKSRDKRLRNIKTMLKRLPTVNFSILKKLICHIYCIIENAEFNEMFLIKLAPIMGPILYYSTLNRSSTEEAVAVSMDIFADLVAGFSWLFDVSPEEMEKERKIEKTLTTLRESKMMSNKTGNDILVGVYMFNRDWDQCINVPLSPNMTAQELVNYVHKKSNLKRPASDLAVFEVVCAGQLERFLHYSEVVMSVILSWTTKWPSEDAKVNYLIVKENDYENLLEPYFDQANTRSGTISLSLFSELKFSDIHSGKVFKKYLFEFIGAKLSIYKDAKASKSIGQWNIEDIVWYIGSESKRNSPNPKLSFTFIERSSKIVRSKETNYMVGRTVVCNTPDEFYKWIAGMIISQYPSGLRPAKKLIDLLD